jgi:WXXGXW repeat (2 copies)
MTDHNTRRLALQRLLGVAAVGIVSACSSRRTAPPISPAPPVSRADVGLREAPPPELDDKMPEPPAIDAYWVPGHWRWEGPGYVWYAGHWERPRPGFVLMRPYWVNDGGQWSLRQARWLPVSHPTEFADIVIAQPPPASRVEVMGRAPGPGYFWLSGYWRWTGGRHVWVAGRWEPYRSGHFWVMAHWVRAGVNYRFVGGYWRRL